MLVRLLALTFLWFKVQQAAAASVGTISSCEVITSLTVNCSLRYKDADRAMLTHPKESAIAANGLRSFAEDCGYDAVPIARVLSEVRASALRCKNVAKPLDPPYAL